MDGWKEQGKGWKGKKEGMKNVSLTDGRRALGRKTYRTAPHTANSFLSSFLLKMTDKLQG